MGVDADLRSRRYAVALQHFVRVTSSAAAAREGSWPRTVPSFLREDLLAEMRARLRRSSVSVGASGAPPGQRARQASIEQSGTSGLPGVRDVLGALGWQARLRDAPATQRVASCCPGRPGRRGCCSSPAGRPAGRCTGRSGRRRCLGPRPAEPKPPPGPRSSRMLRPRTTTQASACSLTWGYSLPQWMDMSTATTAPSARGWPRLRPNTGIWRSAARERRERGALLALGPIRRLPGRVALRAGVLVRRIVALALAGSRPK